MQSLRLASRGLGHLGSFGVPSRWDLHVYIRIYIYYKHIYILSCLAIFLCMI